MKPSKNGSDVGRAAAQALVAVAANMQGSIASAAEAYGMNARKVSKARKMLAAPSEAGGGLVPTREVVSCQTCDPGGAGSRAPIVSVGSRAIFIELKQKVFDYYLEVCLWRTLLPSGDHMGMSVSFLP